MQIKEMQTWFLEDDLESISKKLIIVNTDISYILSLHLP